MVRSGLIRASHSFVTLDAMRGVAAVLILMRHSTLSEHAPLSHSFLAVDFFFALSGFVLYRAYDLRLHQKSLSIWAFMRLRVIRLYPFFLLASTCGFAASVLLAERLGWNILAQEGWVSGSPFKRVVPSYLLSLLMLPNFFAAGALFPLNAPSWTLFFELVANFVVSIIRRFGPFLLIACLGLGGMAGLVTENTLHGLDAGTLWSEFPVGLARVFYSFSVGYLLGHLRRRFEGKSTLLKSNIAFLALIIVTCLTLSFPVSTLPSSAYDLAVTIVIFPALVFAASWVSPKGLMANIATFAGRTSYGVYILQVPVSALLAAGFPSLIVALGDKAPYVFFALLLLLVSGLERHYDLPLRRLLSEPHHDTRGFQTF